MARTLRIQYLVEGRKWLLGADPSWFPLFPSVCSTKGNQDNEAQSYVNYTHHGAGNVTLRDGFNVQRYFNLKRVNAVTNTTRSVAAMVADSVSSNAVSLTLKRGYALNPYSLTLPVTVNFLYDGNGNLTSDGQRTFYHDDENQLTNVTVPYAWKSEFAYDGKQRRRIRREYTWSGGVWQMTNEVRYIYDGNLVIQERNYMNLPVATYTRGLDAAGGPESAGGIGGLLARTDYSCPVTAHAYYFTDNNGNVSVLVGQDQKVVARYLYEPFGALVASSGSLADANSYRFSSKEFDANSGLYYYGYRYYEPNLQRWITKDPAGLAGDANSYAFCNSDPVNNIDPTGQFTWAGVEFLNEEMAILGAIALPGLQKLKVTYDFQKKSYYRTIKFKVGDTVRLNDKDGTVITVQSGNMWPFSAGSNLNKAKCVLDR